MKPTDNIQHKNYFAVIPRWGIGLFLIALLLLIGCAGIEQADDGATTKAQGVAEQIGEVKIKAFMLSPGDEINIAVFQYDELSRSIKIPPNGRFHYPIVGEINVTGKTLEELRQIITKGLSKHKAQMLFPGDEISITVSHHDKLNQQLVIPSDGYIFYPLVGEINTEGKSLRELREIIVSGLSTYKKSYLTPGDEISISVYRNEQLERRLIIPPEGYIFYPLVGEIEVQGKNLKQVREVITTRLSKYIVNPQVEVDLVNADLPKIVVDPQVTLGITKSSSLKRIVDPQVSIEVVGFGGQKVFVLGEVSTPGVFLADGRMGVIEAIARAGGCTLDAKQDSILLVRGGMGKHKPELITLNLENFLAEGDSIRNIILQREDVIYVPRTFISNVDRFFQHLSIIVTPLLSLERGIWIGQQMEGGKGERGGVP